MPKCNKEYISSDAMPRNILHAITLQNTTISFFTAIKISNHKQNITVTGAALQNYNNKMLGLQAVNVWYSTNFTENALLF
jgi:hypothetical protein